MFTVLSTVSSWLRYGPVDAPVLVAVRSCPRCGRLDAAVLLALRSCRRDLVDYSPVLGRLRPHLTQYTRADLELS